MVTGLFFYWTNMALLIDPNSPNGQFLSDRNRLRQFDFLHTSFLISGLGLEIDQEFICSLNMYAMHYVSVQTGRYRRHYNVVVGAHKPSDWSLIPDEMSLFLERLHIEWSKMDPIEAAGYALWGINHIHPFSDGNGRTARALMYFVLCLRLGQWLPGRTTVIELIRDNERDEMCNIMQRMHDAKQPDTMITDLTEITAFLNRLVLKQIQSVAS